MNVRHEVSLIMRALARGLSGGRTPPVVVMTTSPKWSAL